MHWTRSSWWTLVEIILFFMFLLQNAGENSYKIGILEGRKLCGFMVQIWRQGSIKFINSVQCTEASVNVPKHPLNFKAS